MINETKSSLIKHSSWKIYLTETDVRHFELVLVNSSAQTTVKQLHTSAQSSLCKLSPFQQTSLS